jgi:glucosylceramidase
VRFIEEYGKNGVPIWGLTVQNEPMAVQTWESCIYTAEEERDFVKHHLGPALHRAGLEDVKVMIWDHNRGLLYQRAMVTLEDPEAAKYVWGTAFHWYVGDHFDNMRLVHDAFPSKKLLFSEGCHGPFKWDEIGEWSTGEMYGRSIIHDINGWSSGWTDWNILLDETGGPNHVKNFCFAPIIADTRDGSLHYMSSYYYIGHFSRFVRPGARRVACSSTSDDLFATAFVNPDGGKVTVVMNPTDKAMDYQVWTERHIARSSLPAHSIATLRW